MSQIVQRIMDDTGYLAQLEQDTSIDAMSRVENLRELLSVTAEFEARHAEPAEDGSGGPDDLGAFLEEVALLTDIDRTDLGGDQVTLMTVHTAKGLEFPVVFMAGMEERIFPLRRYVRARSRRSAGLPTHHQGQGQALHDASRHQDHLRHDREEQPSRFIQEIPEHLREMP